MWLLNAIVLRYLMGTFPSQKTPDGYKHLMAKTLSFEVFPVLLFSVKALKLNVTLNKLP